MKKIIILSSLIAIALSGCNLLPAKTQQNDLLNILPADSHIAIQVNYDDIAQKENFKEIANAFPKSGISPLLISEINNTIGDQYTYEEDIKPFLESNFKLIIGGKIDMSDPENIENKSEFYIGGIFKDKDLIEKILEEIEKDELCETKNTETATYWTCQNDDIYIAQQDDAFFITNSEENRENALKRLEENNGFKDDNYFTNLDTKNVIAKYIVTKELFENIPNNLANKMPIGDIYGTLRAKEKQIVTESISTETGYMTKPETAYTFDIAQKVSSKGLILYAEQANLYEYLQGFWIGFQQGFNTEDIGIELPSYDDILSIVATEIKTTSEEIEEFTKLPFAFSISNTTNYTPSFAFYIQTTEKTAPTAIKIQEYLNSFADETIIALNEELKNEETIGKDLIKKENVIINGGQVNKVYFDTTQLPEDFINEGIMTTGLDIQDIKAELYYGLTGDNVFIIALDPNFDKTYGQNTVNEQKFMKLLQNETTTDSLNAISYFNPTPLIGITDTYFNLYTRMEIFGIKEKVIYNKIKDTIKTIDYFIAESGFKDETIKSKGSMYLK